MKNRKDLRRSSLAVSNKQRFSIRKLSIGVVSVLLGTTLCFIGEANGNTVTAYADSTPQTAQVATNQQGNYTSDTDANQDIDKYAKQVQDDYNNSHDNKIVISPSTDVPETATNQQELNSKTQSIKDDIDNKVNNIEEQDSSVGPNTKGEDASYFTGQNLHDSDEPNATITDVKISNGNDSYDYKTQANRRYGEDVIYTTQLTNHEINDMRIGQSSNSRLIVNNCENGETITVTYDNLQNSYYMNTFTKEKTQITRVVRTFSDIYSDAQGHYDGWYYTNPNPQLIIYSNPNDGFNYTDIRSFAVSDTYYDANGNEISFDTSGKDNSWIFVTSLNSNGAYSTQIEEVGARDANGSDLKFVPIKGSTISEHSDGMWYSNVNNNNISTPVGTWDTTDNPYAYIGAVAVQYKPGMKLLFGQGGNLDITWAHYQTQLISTKGQQVITYSHVQDLQEPAVPRQATVKSTVHYVMSDGTEAPEDNVQEVIFTENGTHDDVTGNDIYVPAESQTFKNVDSPKIKGYTVDKKTVKGLTVKFGDNDIYTVVTYTPQTEKVSDSKTVKETVHYKYSDGTKAADDKTQTLTFTREGEKNDATGETTWGDWTPAQTFDAVTSPAITGYTPDQAQIDQITVEANDSNIVKTVTYTANDQKAQITYIDDTTGKTLKTDKATGKYNADIDFTKKPSDQISDYEKAGYELVSNDFINQKYSEDNAKNVFVVHLKHGKKTITDQTKLQKTITETIHYVYSNGNEAAKGHTASVIFTRTGMHDEVTGEDIYGNWSPAQSFDAVTSPAITGYTPDQAKIDEISVSATDDNVVKTVTYTANDQKAQITYIDDTTGKTLKTDSTDGRFGSQIDFGTDPAAQIKDYESQGYKLVSNSFNGQTYQADNAKNQFEVHLVHGTKDVAREDTVTRTIHYVYDNGQMAKPDVTQTVKFTETGVHDNVTEADTWTPASAQNIAEVNSPVIDGYTPDRAQVDSATVNFGDKDSEVTVTYAANAQTAGITYIDDTTGKTLKTDSADGKFGSDITFNTDPATQIKNYEGQGYKLVSNSFNGQKYQADNTKNQFEVHLKHRTVDPAQNVTVKETIHYVYENGKTAASDSINTINFSRHGNQDQVTGVITWKNWDKDSDRFAAVISPTITGYTPDQKTIDAITVTGDSEDIEKTVIYKVNDQKARIVYIDDTTHKTLATNSANGKFSENIAFNTDPAAQIRTYEGQGYKLVSNNFNGQTYQADNAKNQFEVHLIHGTHQVTRQHDVKQTINYVFDNGKTASDSNVQVLHFTETGVHDDVTNTDTWTPAAGQSYKSVASPSLPGYTADKKNVPSTSVDFDSQDSKITVTYIANAQTAGITYIDDTTGKTLKTDNADGKFGSQIKFGIDPASQIKTYEGQGYKLVSNSFTGQTYQADNAKNQFEVHLTHGTKTVTRNDTVKRTIHYVYDNGKTAKPDVIQTVNFTETGVHDNVTGIDTWTPASAQDIAEANSPVITGYTPDCAQVDSATVNFGDKDSEVTVTYAANAQTAGITYIDDTTGKTLKTDNADGKFGNKIDFGTDPAAQINDYKSQGYELVSNSFSGQTYQADNDKNQFEVHLVHGTKNVAREDTVKRTIHYVYDNGQMAKPDVTQTVKFTENGVHDNVTGTDTWTSAPAQSFTEVDSPAIAGYTSDKAKVDSATVNFGDKDSEVTVTYAANAQTAGITYIDDTTGKTLKTDSANGKFGSQIDFGTDPAAQIKAYEGQGYKMVSNSFSGQTYQADNAKNQFEVHLIHGTHQVTRQHDVKQTIDYVFDNGSTAADNNVQVLHFTETGVHDDVTNTDTWTSAAGQSYKTVTSPDLPGYTADKANVPSTSVDFDSQDSKITVTYTANAQTAGITYIDDTTGKTLMTDSAAGKFGSDIAFNTDPATQIKDYEGQGYELVSNSFKGQKYQADNAMNQFEVHLKHGTQNVTQDDTVTRTIHYVYGNGKTAKPDVTQTVNFQKHGIHDNVTGIDTWTTTPAQSFEAVETPSIKGYSPDKTIVDSATSNFGDQNSEVTVTYTPVIEAVTDSKTVNETIHYVYEDGTKAHDDYVATPLTFTRQGKKNDVTGVITWGEWTPAQDFAAVVSPTIDGYAPDQKSIAQVTVTGDSDDVDKTVTYTAVMPWTPLTPSHKTETVTPSETPTETDQTGQPDTQKSTTEVKTSGTATTAMGETNSVSSSNARTTAPATAPQSQTSKQSAQELPQTGNDNTASLVALGFSTMAAMFGFSLKKRKEDKD